MQVGEPRGPGRPELTAAPKSFIPTGTGTKSLWAELCAHDTHPNLGPRGWSAGGASSRTIKANSNTVLSVQIIRDCIVAIFVIADYSRIISCKKTGIWRGIQVIDFSHSMVILDSLKLKVFVRKSRLQDTFYLQIVIRI